MRPTTDDARGATDASESRIRQLRKRVGSVVFDAVIIGLVVLFGALGLGLIKHFTDALDPDPEPTSTTGPTTSSTSSTTTTTAVVAGAELVRCEPPVNADGLDWVQVESSTVESNDWVAPQVAEASGLPLEFCDGAAFRSSGSTLMLSTPFTEEETERLGTADPPPGLAPVCALRKEMRIAGGELPYRSPDMATYFSNFILRPSGDWIGPTRCFPLLAGDEEFGSRAALDRYFGILDALSGDPADLPAVAADLNEVTTPEFRAKSGEITGILKAWSMCKKVDVKYLSAPQKVKTFDHVTVHVDCEDAGGARKDRPYVLAVAPPALAGGIWRLHWDPDHWGAVPPAT